MTATGDRAPLDRARAEAFAGQLLAALNHGALCLMLSVGHRTGLFDVMSSAPPGTSEEVAAWAGLHERYVREWLGAMTTSGVVEYEPVSRRFRLPPEHAAGLTRSTAADNMALFAQYFAVLGAVEDDIVECFRKGGGVPYARYPRFHEVMAEDSGQSVLSSLETHVLPLVPGLAVRLADGVRLLDAGCGRGAILNRLAALYPRSRFVGIDLSEEAIGYARREAAQAGHRNVEFRLADLGDFDQTAPPEAFEAITTFDAVHDQARPLNLLRGIHRALTADGTYLMQEIGGTGRLQDDVAHPLGTLLYTISCMHCMTVSLARGGEGLGAMWGEARVREYLTEAGFRSITAHRLAHDVQNVWYVVGK